MKIASVLKERKRNTFLARKSFRSPVLLICGAFFVGLLFPLFVSASTIFEDSFNSYIDNPLNTQGNWSGDPNFVVQGITKREGAKAIYMTSTGDKSILKTGEALTSGKITIYVLTKEHADIGVDYYVFLNVYSSVTGLACRIGFYEDFIKMRQGSSWVNLQTYDDNHWYAIQFEWRNTPDYKYRVKIDSGEWTDWFAGHSAGGNWTSGLNTVGITSYVEAGSNFESYYDYIAENPLGTVGELEENISIVPEYPVDGAITQDDYAFNATGNWAVGDNSSVCYRKISIYFEDVETGEILGFTEDISGDAGTSGAYSIAVSGLEDKNYYVWYRASGYLFCIPLMGNVVYTTHRIENTIARIGSFPELPIEIETKLLYPESPFEECSGYALLERLVCEIKNFGFSLIYPKPEHAVLLKRNLEQIKYKAPINYISLVKTEFEDIKNALAQNDITFTLFGNEATVDFSLFDKQFTFQGLTFSFKNLILYFTNFILAMIFIAYLLTVVKRIF